MADITGIVVCRQASDYLKPGYQLGFACRVCGKALQVSPPAAEQIKNHGMIPLCNDCGFAMQKRLQDAHAPMDVIFSPEATRALDEIAAQVRQKARNN
jgi:transcription elongation factor Elf1